jgi:putative chitinase
MYSRHGPVARWRKLRGIKKQTMKLDANMLRQIAPATRPGNLSMYAPLLTELMPKYGINTPKRVTAFLAQLAHESASFNATEEYASGQAYEGRKDLGNVNPGDGKRFKGRGLIQITGRFNYAACSKALFGDMTLIKHPEKLKEPKYAVESACWYWRTWGLNEVADNEDTWTHTTRNPDGTPKHTYNKFEWLTKLINGGQNGLTERKIFYARAKQVIQ